MNKKLLFVLLVSLFCSGSIFAEVDSSSEDSDSETPWLVGNSKNVPMKPVISAPLFDMSIGDENGAKLPEEVTEDEPLTVSAISNIFFDDPPLKSITGEEFNQAQW